MAEVTPPASTPFASTPPVLASRVLASEEPSEFLDAFACAAFPVWLPSRNSARNAVKRGEVRVDGVEVTPSFVVRPGMRVTLHPSARPPPPALRIPLDVLYEDPSVAAVDKPAGLETSGTFGKTAERALSGVLPAPDAPDALPWPRPVHRLDPGTQGILLIARTRGAQVGLGRAFEEGRVRQRYRAILVGRLEGEGEVDQPLDGRRARTLYRAVAHTRALKGGWVTAADLWPLTGRTHQVRRHAAALGFPVLGDGIYGKEKLILEGKGLFLCAIEIGFAHPITRDLIWIARKEPSKFRIFCDREASRWARHQDPQP